MILTISSILTQANLTHLTGVWIMTQKRLSLARKLNLQWFSPAILHPTSWSGLYRGSVRLWPVEMFQPQLQPKLHSLFDLSALAPTQQI